MSGIKDCCPSDLPPVVSTGYTLKGAHSEVLGVNTYITGSPTSKRGLLTIYDVFGNASQTLQGADLLASALDAVVLVPDFLHGQYAQEIWFQDPTPENQAAQKKFREAAEIGKHAPKVMDFAVGLKNEYPTVTSWAMLGLCWGGKLTALTSGKDTPFKVSGQVHPSRLERKDAEALTIPHIILCAPSDNKEGGVDAYIDVFKSGKIGYVETYEGMFHGWMGGRASLEDEKNKKEYERGYKAVADYFSKHLRKSADSMI